MHKFLFLATNFPFTNFEKNFDLLQLTGDGSLGRIFFAELGR